MSGVTETPELDNLCRVLDVLPDGVIAADEHGNIAYANAAGEAVFGYAAGELLGQPLNVLVPAGQRRAHDVHLMRARQSGMKRSMSERPIQSGVRRSGEEIPVSIAVAVVEADGRAFQVAVVRDQRVIVDALYRAQVAAETDSLTGIGNRRHLSDRLGHLAGSKRSYSLICLDLDRFKQLNDRHGHALGDAVLRIVAKRLQSCLRKGDVCVRMGGDEFVVVLPDVEDATLVQSIAAKLEAHILEPVHVENVTVSVGVSIGAVLAAREESESALMQRADAALYEAKRSDVPPRIRVVRAGG